MCRYGQTSTDESTMLRSQPINCVSSILDVSDFINYRPGNVSLNQLGTGSGIWGRER